MSNDGAVKRANYFQVILSQTDLSYAAVVTNKRDNNDQVLELFKDSSIPSYMPLSPLLTSSSTYCP